MKDFATVQFILVYSIDLSDLSALSLSLSLSLQLILISMIGCLTCLVSK